MNIPARYWTAERRVAYEQRQAETVSWELTFFEIQALPITNDCPPEERLA